MSIERYGAEQAGAGGKSLPFARAVEADGWLHVSGQVAMENGEVIEGNIVAQAHKAIGNLLAILEEAGYGVEHVVRVGVWLEIHAISGASTKSIRNISVLIPWHGPAYNLR